MTVDRTTPVAVKAALFVSDVLRHPRKSQQGTAGFTFAIGKRSIYHSMNLRHNGMLAIPICATFLRDALTQHASVAAFNLLGLDEIAISTDELRALGFPVPPNRARFRWVVFRSPEEREFYAAVHDMLVALGIDAPHPEEDSTPFSPFTPTDLPGPDGRAVAVLCPFHTDSRPSASIFAPSPRGYGAGVCHKCRGPDGRALRFCWRRLDDGSFGARVARGHREDDREWTHEEPKQSGRRYNGGPTGRVGRIYGATVGVSLRSFVGRSGSWVAGTSTASLRGGVIEAIVRSERTADYGNVRPAVVDHEFEAAARRERDAAAGLPARPANADARDRLIRVQPQFSTETTTLRSGVSIPGGWKDAGVANVLVDLDGLNLGSDATAREWAARVLAVVKRDRRCSGRATVVRTSAGGAQVVVELTRPIAGRLPAEAWFAADGPRRWYADLGERLLAAAWSLGAEGGEIDWSAFGPGRLARRPGWRVTRTGEAYRAQLLAAAA